MTNQQNDMCVQQTQISLVICRKVHSKDSDQTGQMPRLILVFAGCTDPSAVAQFFLRSVFMVHPVQSCQSRSKNGSTTTVNFLNIWTPKEFVVITLKIEQDGVS